ncbi:hypothetical protein ACEZDB_26945 [Streptacidiphilus sp. N1-3]|uniref:FUSC family protein n=1 Tax=Streptacidiphilus alkalitolerans TaxID=3342712 RepID=A0ABV6X831_9ACTN
MSTDQPGLRERIRFTYNVTAASAGAILLPWTLRVLHVAGDQYGVGLALLCTAVVADRRLHHWVTRTLVCTVVLANVADHHALMQSLSYFLGATS